MHAAFHRAVVVLLLGILPLQSMAAALLPFACSPVSVPTPLVHEHAQTDRIHQHAAGSAHHSHDGEQQAHDAPGGHLCCHQFSAVPAMQFLPAPQDFRVYASAPVRVTPLHIPDLPQRPPRA